MNRKQLKKQTRARLKPVLGYTFLALILWTLVLSASLVVGLVIGPILVLGALSVSRIIYFLDVANGNEKRAKDVNAMFCGFPHFGRVLKTTISYYLLFLVGILIPAIIYFGLGYLSYYVLQSPLAGLIFTILSIVILVSFLLMMLMFFYFIPYVLADKRFNDFKIKQILNLSFKLGKKNFFKIIAFELSFILWRLGVIFTAFMLNAYFIPYYQTARAALYLEYVDRLGVLPPQKEEEDEFKEDYHQDFMENLDETSFDTSLPDPTLSEEQLLIISTPDNPFENSQPQRVQSEAPRPFVVIPSQPLGMEAPRPVVENSPKPATSEPVTPFVVEPAQLEANEQAQQTPDPQLEEVSTPPNPLNPHGSSASAPVVNNIPPAPKPTEPFRKKPATNLFDGLLSSLKDENGSGE